MTARSRNASAAFTLVEVIVVVGVIVIVIGILLPTINVARQRGNATRCASNLRQIVQASLARRTGGRRLPSVGRQHHGADGD
jgi:type II secretory pathway pseudopilin PulG